MPQPRSIASGILSPTVAKGMRLFAGMAALAFFLFVFTAYALPPQRFVVEKIRLLTENGVLCVALDLTVDDEDGLRDLLKDGAELGLSVNITLERKRSWWSNKTMKEDSHLSHLRHDPLTREFIYFASDSSAPPSRDKNLTRLLHTVLRNTLLPVLPLSQLAAEGANNEYHVLVRIDLNYEGIPPWLEKSPVFWSSEVLPPYEEVLPFQY